MRGHIQGALTCVDVDDRVGVALQASVAAEQTAQAFIALIRLGFGVIDLVIEREFAPGEVREGILRDAA